MDKKRILHVSKFFYPYYGGIEDVVYTIIKGLKNTYDQQVICFAENGRTSHEVIDEIPVTRVGILGTLFSQPIPRGYKKQLNRLINSFRPDIIHLHLPNPLVCSCILHCNLRGAKVVVHWHADILGKDFMYWMIRPLEQRVLALADHIIATSHEYVTLSQPLQPYTDKISILPNTINEHKFSISQSDLLEVEQIRKRYQHKPIVLFVGRHVEYKGIRYLIRSAALLKHDAVVLIAGTGILTQQLRTLAKGQHNVVFLGRVPNEHIKLYLHAADVFAFPSIDRREAFGVALAEALYCGLPAVSFHIDGSGTTFVNQNGKTGIVVPNRDAEAFAQALDELLADDAKRAEMGQAAHEWAVQHFLSDQVQVLHAVYG